MTGALDTKMRALALSLISRYGQSATWSAIGGSSTFNPATGRTTEAGSSYSVTVSPPSPVDISLVDGSTIQATDETVLIAASGLAFTPKIGDRVTLSSVAYRVVRVSPIFSGAQVAAYEAQCRK